MQTIDLRFIYESVQFFGLGVNVTNYNVNDTRLNFEVEQFGLGNINANTQANFVWNEPVAHDDGTVEFDFGINYDNFPVTWVNVTDPVNSFSEQQDIGYHYKVFVNPETGFCQN